MMLTFCVRPPVDEAATLSELTLPASAIWDEDA